MKFGTRLAIKAVVASAFYIPYKLLNGGFRAKTSFWMDFLVIFVALLIANLIVAAISRRKKDR